MKLYGYWRSTATWRVRIGLSYKQIPFEYEAVNLRKEKGDQHSDGYKEKNPMSQVPLLEFNDPKSGRQVRLTQSVAILEYLEESFGGVPLLPKEPVARAKARQIAELVNAGIQPLQNLSVNQYVKNQLQGDEKAWTTYWVQKGLVALEALVKESAGRFSVGDSVSMGDLFIVPELYYARTFPMPLEAYPTLLRVEAACMALPSFVSAHAENQPDAPK